MSSYGEPRLSADPRTNFIDDMTSTAGLTLMVGIIAFVFGVFNLVSLNYDNVDWDGADGVFPPILPLLGQLTQSLFGLVSVFVGFQWVASKSGSAMLSLFGLAATLAAWFPFLVQISLISFNANKKIIDKPPLVPFPGASSGEINAVAIMGILGFMGYAGTVIGALTFLHWKMYRCFAGYAHTYSASYYRSRLTYYGFLVTMTGAVQLALGAYVLDKLEGGPLAAPVITGAFFILWPELSIFVGAMQLVVGFMTLYRSTTPGVGPSTGNRDSMLSVYQMISWFVFVASVGCQVLGQIHSFGGSDPNPTPAIFLLNIVGFSLFPMYLDVMAHTTPENVTKDMFSVSKTMGPGA